MSPIQIPVQIPVQGPFSLAASATFLHGFAPAAHTGATSADHFHLAFLVEGEWRPVGLCVHQRDDGQDGGPVEAEAFGDGAQDSDAVRQQLTRILSLDVDGKGYAAVGQRDPVLGRLQDQYPGLRPVCFWSPYEAACWAVIGQRIRMTQAAAIKQRIAAQHGSAVTIHDEQLMAFPAPAVLRDIADQLDIPQVKRARLAGIAEAALDGRLDAAHLRGMDGDAALAELLELDGVGPFSAELILLRGAGHPDRAPGHEQRLLDAVGTLYDRSPPSGAELEEIAAAWRPYRTWCAVLIRTWWDDEARAGRR